MLKIYRIKQISASILVYVQGKPVRVEFRQGTFGTDFHGQFSTSDEALQRAIEKDAKFGTLHSGMIYLYETYGESETAPEVVVEPEIIPEPNKPEEGSKSMTFVQAKQYLIEKGISPDELKNFLQVKSQAGKLGIEIVK